MRPRFGRNNLGKNPYLNNQRFTFLRQDLLNRYLKDTGSALIRTLWGERLYHSRGHGSGGPLPENERYAVYQDFFRYRENISVKSE